MSTWYNVATPDEQARLVAAWEEAPIENEELCSSLLEVARGQVTAYAPDPDGHGQVGSYGGYIQADAPIWDVDNPPVNYVYAQLQQAINLWNAGRSSQDGTVGAEGFSFTPRPLDKVIRNIIRPLDGRPHVL